MNNLEGKIAAQGKVEAKAFVTNNPTEIPPFKDYVLVTQNADPSISPLLYNAKGVITEIGGLMSHLAVISRELGIPCVTACDNSYSTLKTGYLVRIHATEKLNSVIKIEYDN